MTGAVQSEELALGQVSHRRELRSESHTDLNAAPSFPDKSQHFKLSVN